MCDVWTCSETEIDKWNVLCEATTVATDDNENGEENFRRLSVGTSDFFLEGKELKDPFKG